MLCSTQVKFVKSLTSLILLVFVFFWERCSKIVYAGILALWYHLTYFWQNFPHSTLSNFQSMCVGGEGVWRYGSAIKKELLILLKSSAIVWIGTGLSNEWWDHVEQRLAIHDHPATSQPPTGRRGQPMPA